MRRGTIVRTAMIVLTVVFLVFALTYWLRLEDQEAPVQYQEQEETPAPLQEETVGPTDNYLPATGGPS